MLRNAQMESSHFLVYPASTDARRIAERVWHVPLQQAQAVEKKVPGVATGGLLVANRG